MKQLPRNTKIGNDILCAWQPAPGVVWVQTRSPFLAEKLAGRSDGTRVAYSVTGGYLRTYEFKHDIAWAKSLVERYTSKLEAANRAKMTQKPSALGPEEF